MAQNTSDADIARLEAELAETESKIAASSAGSVLGKRRDVTGSNPTELQSTQSRIDSLRSNLNRDTRADTPPATAGEAARRTLSPESPAGSAAAGPSDNPVPRPPSSTARPFTPHRRGASSTSNPAGYSGSPLQIREDQRGMASTQSRRETKDSAGSSSSDRSDREFRELVSDLNEAQQILLNELIQINGQDSYDSVSAGIGKLRSDEYLVLPLGFSQPRVAPEDVGRPTAHATIAYTDWGQIYALNKNAAPQGVDPATFGLLRLEAVKAGWLDGMREVRYENPIDDALRTLVTDMASLRDKAQLVKTAAFLVPLAAEHTFRTMGHHFITSDQANYVQRYSDTFRSCLYPEISTLLPAATLYHAALHWVSPGRARSVLMAQLDSTQIPDALRIRSNAAPAGTAILTTTNAIIEAMGSVGLDDAFDRFGNFGLTEIREMTQVVKQDPCRYHKSYFAYGVAKPSAQALERLEAAKALAVKFSPYAQAFIDTYMREAALGRARAIKKHSDGNPIQYRRATTLFRAIARAPVTSVEDLIKAQLAVSRPDDDFVRV